MASSRALWITLAVAVGGGFAVLGFFGREVYRHAPPIPEQFALADGDTLWTGEEILDGQEVWQSMGGQQVGSIWGHGAYQAPDWTADWLHREATTILSLWTAREYGGGFAALDREQQGALEARLRHAMRTNTFDAKTGTVTLTDDRVAAVREVAAHYDALFGGAPELHDLRESYAISEVPVPDAARREKLAAFFFWTAWASTTERPDATVTYTNNWPHEPLVGNTPSTANIMWSIISVIILLAGVGGLVWFMAFRNRDEEDATPPSEDPLSRLSLTPSMRAVWKYAAVVIALLVVQVTLGAITAHYTVEGQSFFGVPLGEVLPYAVTRTWHIQTGIFWIATAFLGFGLFIAPLVGGREPRWQRLGVNVLFGALVVVVGGSLTGEWLRIQGHLGDTAGFWFGHQGYEYVDLGRAWQIALTGGLALWLVLMLRALWPALTKRDSRRPLLLLFTGSVVAISVFYAAGLMYGARTHLSVMEYWRWWVVHLWVEGFFEVFATAAVAFLFYRMGLVRVGSATAAVLFSSIVYLASGIPGTFHHLYFSGTPVSIMAVGASFSALEVVPLVLIGFEAFSSLRTARAADWMRRYRWPVRFFLGVAFWNLVGAGLFGFLINPPIALYYMQGLNTTPVHGHAALFGVYGLLALGLTLLVLRRLKPELEWNDRPLTVAFWGMNGGLTLMIVLSLLPVGLLQAAASMDQGLWWARSAEFLQQPLLETLRWMRLVGDSVFLVGVGALTYFTIGLATGWSLARTDEIASEPVADAAKHTAHAH